MGATLGIREGTTLGDADTNTGLSLGKVLGTSETLGCDDVEGPIVGNLVGFREGTTLGNLVGFTEGIAEGL